MEKGKSPIKINWSYVITIVGIILTAIWKFYPVEAKLRYNVLANTSVLDVKADVAKLHVSYDSIDLLKNKQNISVILVEVRNDGNKDIRLDDYDQNSDFGMEISGGKILSNPELNSSSDNKYYRDIISSYDNKSVKFQHKLIDGDQYFTVKMLVLHSREIIPEIVPIGKISGLKRIEVTNSLESNAELVALREKNRTLLMFFIMTLMMGLLLFVIRTQRAKNRELLLRNQYFASLQNQSTTSPGSSDELEELLSIEELVKLKKGDLVYHEKFGRGKVVEIEKNADLSQSKGTFEFEKRGRVRLLLRFSPLYRMND